MTCSCPKCNASIDIDLAHIPSAGHYTPCPSCKSRFWAQKESFINRAFKKEGQIYCINCDAELGLSHICTQCSTLLPDYCLVQRTKPPRRKEESTGFSFDFSFSAGGGGASSSVSAKRSSSGSKALYVKIAILLVVVAGAVFGGVYYKKDKEESTYVKNYVRALNGIKTCADTDFNVFIKMRENVGYGLSSQEIDKINNAKTEVDSRIALLAKVPKKYLQQNEKILSLNDVYGKLHALVLSPSASSSIDNAMLLETNFNKSALELKSVLTSDITAEIKKSSSRYKNMEIFYE